MFQETAEPRHTHGSCSIMDGKDRPQNWIAYPLKTDRKNRDRKYIMEWLKPFNTKKELDKNCMDLLTHFVKNKAKEEIRDFVENDEPFDDEFFDEYWDMFDEYEYIAGRYDKLYNWYYCLEKLSENNLSVKALIYQIIYYWKNTEGFDVKKLMVMVYKSTLCDFYQERKEHFRKVRKTIIDDYMKSKAA